MTGNEQKQWNIQRYFLIERIEKIRTAREITEETEKKGEYSACSSSILNNT